MRSKEVIKTDEIFYNCTTALRISEDNPMIERGIFLDGIKITTVEEWNKAIEEFKKRENDYIHKDKIRDKIKELEDKEKSYGNFIDKDECFSITSKKSVLKELLGE